MVPHIEHMLEHAGENSVGLGSDFDGAMIPAELGNAAGLQNLVQAMRKRGFEKPLIGSVLPQLAARAGTTWGRAGSL